MKLSNRVMVCSCGNVMDRDLNAAINLKNKAVSSTVTACEAGRFVYVMLIDADILERLLKIREGT